MQRIALTTACALIRLIDVRAARCDSGRMFRCGVGRLPFTAMILGFMAPGCAGILSLDQYEESADSGAGAGSGGQGDAGVSACELSVDPASWDFGMVVVGEVSPPLKLLVASDHGPKTAPLSLIGGNPPNPAFSIVGQTCQGASLAWGETCTIDFVFAPETVGTQTAPLFIRAGESECATAFLRGEGVSSPPPDAGSPPADAGAPPTEAVVVDPPLVSATQIGLSWSAVANATEYGVLWSNVTGGAGFTVTTTWAILDTDTSLEHWFTIYACNAAGCGPPAYAGPVKR